jgi:cell division protease FtsH
MSENQSENQKNDSNENKNKKPKVPPMPKFNFYWIYGIIAVVFIALTFLPKNGANKTSKIEFINKMLLAHDVEKVVVVNKSVAEIYLKKEALKNDKYKDLKDRRICWSALLF